MSHKIQKQVLQLDIPSGHDSWRFQNQMRDTFNELVLPKLEQVCDELGLDDSTVLKIDSLLLDTGQISSNGLAQEWVSQIEYQFREQIKRLKVKGASAVEKVEVQNSDQSDLSAVLHFLKLGVLPWWAKDEHPGALREMVSKVVAEQAGALSAQLKRQQNQGLAIRRLLRLLSPESLTQFRAALNNQPPLGEALSRLFKSHKVKLSNGALLRLNSIELIQLLTENSIDPETIFYQWASAEIAFGSTSKKQINTIHKKLYIRILKTKGKEKVETELTKQLTVVFERLEKEQQLEPADGKRSYFGDVKEAGKAQQSHPETSSPDAQKHKADQEQTKKTQGSIEGKAPPNKPKDGALASCPKDPKAKSNNSTPASKSQEQLKQSSSTKGTASQDQLGPQPTKPNKAEFKKKTSTGLSKQDAHVFEQLERIRKAALKKQTEDQDSNQQEPEGNEAGIQANQDLAASDHLPEEVAKNAVTSSELAKSSLLPSEASDQDINSPEAIQESPRYRYELPQVEVEECYLTNAGLILFWPFLGRFFKNLGFVENQAFISTEAQEKAVLMLQYLLGEAPELDEHALPLNKLICALPIEHPITADYSISEEEKEKCQELLQSTIDNWGMLKGTSISGFQGSFLNREAVLKKQENGWLLQVEKQAFDMLLEHLPWPLSIVKLTWMNEPIYVEW